MFTTLVSATLVLALAAPTFAEFTVYTPSTLTQCQDAQISWDQTTGPYNLIIVPGDDPCSDTLVDLGDQDGTSMTWNVNVASGTNVMLSLEDANGDEAWSGAMTVGGSDDSSCLAAASSAASSAWESATSAASSAADISGTTLVVSNTAKAASATSAAASASSSISVVGAANAGLDPTSSGALSVRQYSISAMLLGAVVGLIALA